MKIICKKSQVGFTKEDIFQNVMSGEVDDTVERMKSVELT